MHQYVWVLILAALSANSGCHSLFFSLFNPFVISHGSHLLICHTPLQATRWFSPNLPTYCSSILARIWQYLVKMDAKLYTLKLTRDQFELFGIFMQYQDLDVDTAVVEVKDVTGDGESVAVGDANEGFDGADEAGAVVNEGDQAQVQEEVLPDDDDDDDEEEEFRDGECRVCLAVPCVTTHPKRWLGEGQPANPRKPERNSAIRKKLYKNYWKELKERNVWMDRRYQKRRSAWMKRARDGGMEPVRVEREVMPECVLNHVRGLYPNPPGVEYMGHQWW